MHVLVTNDDGLAAPGLWALACGLAHLGRISVAAPVDSQVGQIGRLGRDRSAVVESIADDHSVDLAALCNAVARVQGLPHSPARRRLVALPGGRSRR